MIELKEYQEIAVSELCEKSQRILDRSPGICVLKAPTGSGKTVMMAEAIKKMSCSVVNKNKLSYIWISIHKLHTQSKEKLEEHYDGFDVIKCSEYSDIEDLIIGDDEIVFFNWESISRDDNIYIRENEKCNNLSNVLENTRKQERKIIVIIDESHRNVNGPKAQKLLDEINPDLTINVSATPSLNNIDEIVSVDQKDVIFEEMIKKEIHVNSEINSIKVDEETADDIAILAGLQKREQLYELYQKNKSNVNPLLLIQIPDANPGTQDRLDEIVRILQNYDITIENEKLAIWISDKHVNLDNVDEPDNKVQVLIFKQAIAVRWDCPRASILILLRILTKIEFSIQTIGRIMRTPEHRFYDDDTLNNSYVYCNLSEMSIARDIADGYMIFKHSHRNDDVYDGIILPSIYIKRRHEKTRISGKITDIMCGLPDATDIAKTISKKIESFTDSIMCDGVITKLDKEQMVTAEEISIPKGKKKLNRLFEDFVRGNVGGFAPVHSTAMLWHAIYEYCRKYLDVNDYVEVQKIVLSDKNNNKFIKLIGKSINSYKEKVVAKIIRDESEDIDWSVPDKIDHGEKYVDLGYKKSIMQPAYIRANKLERDFMKFLDKSENVKWWFRNGVRDKKYFAVPYRNDEGEISPFYVDFVVKMEDSKIGLFDTKSDYTNDQYKDKGLQEYIKKNSNLFGGIVKQDGMQWKYSKMDVFEDQSTWKYLNFD